MNNKAIAKHIKEAYTAGDFCHIANNRVEFVIDGLTLRCCDSVLAVTEMAAKFNRGLRYGGRSTSWPPRPRTGTTPAHTVVASFTNDDEHDNAEQYLRLVQK